MLTRRAALAMAACLPAHTADGPLIDAAFPGGNIVVDRIDGDDVYLHQDPRDTEGFWFYWAFRVRNAGGRTLRFQFTKGDVVGVRGPAMSIDGGRNWQWLGAASGNAHSFQCTLPAQAREVRFAMSIPYQEADLHAFLRGKRIKQSVLTRSKKNRPVELLRLGSEGARRAVLFTARHHSCESMASYVLEGVLGAVLGTSDDGRWLARNADFLVVPFVDKDGVEAGDQGKNRRPRDHNRDYNEESVHPETRAIREQIPKWSRGRVRVALDLHCPTLRGATNETIYFVGGADQTKWKETLRLAAILEKDQRGPLHYIAAKNIPFGASWNTAKNTTQGMSCSQWTSRLEGIRLASTLEFSYSNANDGEVTAASARAFGVDLAHALRVYLESLG